MSEAGLSKVVITINGMHGLDPLNQALESRHVVQQLVPRSLASSFPYFCSCDSVGPQDSGLLGPLPHLSPFTLQPVHLLLPPLGSHRSQGLKNSSVYITLYY
uniref:Uncharacterized protein n=1 Tax=Lynx canadensis TaxID=61383 RepID=A0A667FHE1_LYNCA